MTTRRKIVHIDEELCNGCGLCATACAEGAIEIVNGKARLISETYCDGLGACLGECPQGAITIEEREAAEFDLEAVEEHLARAGAAEAAASVPCGCPGTASQTLTRAAPGAPATFEEAGAQSCRLRNWPVQLHLIPPTAPYLRGARLLIASDCVPFAFADFHRRLLPGRVLLIGCPKLDDAPAYRDKLARILRDNDVASLEVAYMEVPCCFGMVHLVRQAIAASGKALPLGLTKVGIRGEVLEEAPAVQTA
jgi:ferredoxin